MCVRIWKEIRGDEDINFKDRSFGSGSSVAVSPFIRLDPFSADRMKNSGNEIAVEEEEGEEGKSLVEEKDEDGWSDVSV